MRAYLVAGLAFGDEGKGTIVDYLVRQTGAKWVVRYNGGAQAAHHVVTDDGRSHCFSQFGAGTLAGADTYLSRFMMVDPVAFMNEATALVPLAGRRPTVAVDADCLVTTPYHMQLNQAKESARGDARHGSCGRGIGETRRLALESPDTAIRVRDLRDKITLHRKLQWLRDRLRAEGVTPRPTLHWLVRYDEFLNFVQVVEESPLAGFLQHGDVVFEGAQGVLLDELYGFHPHTTWTNTTFDNAETLLREAYDDAYDDLAAITRIGVTRSFATRHGHGPLPSEVACAELVGDHNGPNGWQGMLRVGAFDGVLFDYAMQVLFEKLTPPDVLAVTWMDAFKAAHPVVTAYGDDGAIYPFVHGGLINMPSEVTLDYTEKLGAFLKRPPRLERSSCQLPEGFLNLLEHISGVPVGIVSSGPAAKDKQARGPMAQILGAAAPADATL